METHPRLYRLLLGLGGNRELLHRSVVPFSILFDGSQQTFVNGDKLVFYRVRLNFNFNMIFGLVSHYLTFEEDILSFGSLIFLNCARVPFVGVTLDGVVGLAGCDFDGHTSRDYKLLFVSFGGVRKVLFGGDHLRLRFLNLIFIEVDFFFRFSFIESYWRGEERGERLMKYDRIFIL